MQRFYLCLDEGFTNPAVVLAVGEDADGRLHVFEEYYEAKVVQPVVVEEAGKLWRGYGAGEAVVDDSAAAMREVYRVLRPGGRWVFLVTHPMRWLFLDDPGEDGLVAVHSYFDRRAYVEQDEHGMAALQSGTRSSSSWSTTPAFPAGAASRGSTSTGSRRCCA